MKGMIGSELPCTNELRSWVGFRTALQGHDVIFWFPIPQAGSNVHPLIIFLIKNRQPTDPCDSLRFKCCKALSLRRPVIKISKIEKHLCFRIEAHVFYPIG